MNNEKPSWHGKVEKDPPVPCEFKVGDRVIFVNDYGIPFDNQIIGFAKDDSFYGRFIHHTPSGGGEGAWWFPSKPSSLHPYNEEEYNRLLNEVIARQEERDAKYNQFVEERIAREEKGYA